MNVADLTTCTEHDYLAHVGFHEAGHATAAILLGIDFVDVTINPGPSDFGPPNPGDLVEAGGVRMTTDQPVDWVGPRPVDAMVFLLAGSLAENHFLGHHLEGGWTRDFEIWRIGSGRTGAADGASVAPIIRNGTADARALVAENQSAIHRVYALLVGRAANDLRGTVSFNAAITLTRDEVQGAVFPTA